MRPARSTAPSRRPGRFLPVLLIGALLICHGVLGFAHQTSIGSAHGSPHGCDAPDLARHIAVPGGGHHADGHGAEDPTCGHMSTGYFAVLLALIGAAFLRLLLGASVRRPIAVSPPRLGPRILPALAHPPRGPTLPLLQVFRL